MEDPVVCVLITTYRRTECAVKTIQSIKQNLQWPQLWFMVCDDGSSKEHRSAVIQEIGPTYRIEVFNAERRGVGYGMNHCLRHIFESTDICYLTEDDWTINRPLDLRPYVNVLVNHPETGLVRFGYLCTNLLAYSISLENKLFWRIEPNFETYRYAGHASLRHRRFHEVYGYFDEGLTPGLTELSMCGRVNQKPDGPQILYPCEAGAYGFVSHEGSESLADIQPGY